MLTSGVASRPNFRVTVDVGDAAGTRERPETAGRKGPAITAVSFGQGAFTAVGLGITSR